MFIPKKNKLTVQLNALVPSLESQPAVVEAAVVRQVASELQVPASPAINAAVAFDAHRPYVEARLAEIEHTYMMPRPRAEVVDAVQQQFAARYNIAHDPAQAVAVEEAAECGKVVPEVLVRVASLMQDGEPLASVESFIYAPAEVVGSAAIKSSLEHLAAGLDLDVERDGMAHYKAALEGHALLHAEAARVGATIDEIVGKTIPGLESAGPKDASIFLKAWQAIKAFFMWLAVQLGRFWVWITRKKPSAEIAAVMKMGIAAHYHGQMAAMYTKRGDMVRMLRHAFEFAKRAPESLATAVGLTPEAFKEAQAEIDAGLKAGLESAQNPLVPIYRRLANISSIATEMENFGSEDDVEAQNAVRRIYYSTGYDEYFKAAHSDREIGTYEALVDWLEKTDNLDPEKSSVKFPFDGEPVIGEELKAFRQKYGVKNRPSSRELRDALLAHAGQFDPEAMLDRAGDFHGRRKLLDIAKKASDRLEKISFDKAFDNMARLAAHSHPSGDEVSGIAGIQGELRSCGNGIAAFMTDYQRANRALEMFARFIGELAELAALSEKHHIDLAKLEVPRPILEGVEKIKKEGVDRAREFAKALGH